MPVNGLPIMLERILNMLLQDSSVSSYKLAAQHGPRSTIVIRFDSDAPMADSGVAQPSNRSTPATSFYRKSPSQIRRDQRRKLNYRLTKDKCFRSDSETDGERQERESKTEQVGDSTTSNTIPHTSISTCVSSSQSCNTDPTAHFIDSIEHCNTPQTTRDDDSGVKLSVKSQSFDEIDETNTLKPDSRSCDPDTADESSTFFDMDSPFADVSKCQSFSNQDMEEIKIATDQTVDSSHSDSNSATDSRYADTHETEGHEIKQEERKEVKDREKTTINNEQQSAQGSENLFLSDEPIKTFILDYMDNEFISRRINNKDRNKCVLKAVFDSEFIHALTDDLIIEYCLEREKVTNISLITGDCEYPNDNWRYTFGQDDKEYIKQNHMKHYRKIKTQIPDIIQLIRGRPAKAETLKENKAKSKGK